MGHKSVLEFKFFGCGNNLLDICVMIVAVKLLCSHCCGHLLLLLERLSVHSLIISRAYTIAQMISYNKEIMNQFMCTVSFREQGSYSCLRHKSVSNVLLNGQTENS